MRAVACLVCLLAACGGGGSATDASPEGGGTDGGGTDGARPDLADCADEDSDGHRAASCGGDDCDDHDASRFPGNTEVCDSAEHDEDCDAATFGMRDSDADGHVDQACCNGLPSGPQCGDDCNDAQMTVHPGATEACNGFDDDCNGLTDEGVISTFYSDCDGDGYGGMAGTMGCVAPSTPPPCAGALWITVGGDCDDANAIVSPAQSETCNGVDDDCDGTVDDGGDAWCAGALAHTGAATCAGGTCSITTCSPGFFDCDTTTATGCEIDGTSDPFHCGGCSGFCDFACTASACDAVLQVSAGEMHTCALLTSGVVACWGENGSGQLGDGTTIDRSSPTRVPGVVDAIAISGGKAFTCALHASGTVSCWGDDTFGQLGDGTTSASPRLSPVDVSGVTGAVEISAGAHHACARRSSGAVSCWGGNASGELGDGTTTSSATPTTVSGLADATSIAAGGAHTCAVRAGGTVQCWGANGYTQLGDGTVTNRSTPTTVVGVSGATQVTAGEQHTCVLLSTGGAECWGSNLNGELGSGSPFPSDSPGLVATGATYTQISAGASRVGYGQHVCATTSSGDAECWGANGVGQCGNTMFASFPAPVNVDGLLGVSQVTAGTTQSCAIVLGGVYCWGGNGSGELGDGTTVSSTYPVHAMLAD